MTPPRLCVSLRCALLLLAPTLSQAAEPDGAKLYVANGRSNSVSVIDTKALVRRADVPVGEAPWGVVIRAR